ncbi:hypothetical protein DFR70_11320 [Nocardia tenerifensis]|uniref:Uncharacterized protein n=1 Tax=Nocardia tenerifensis TaxID=228006 RepID=A0A318JRS8_9NOCA|nr:hypothetical protein [Nocardia tenerifensis]PXX58685.1 hypothetical protein DFR70_11320 [Nocardia tenerifensis]
MGEELGSSSNTGKLVGLTCGRAETLTAAAGDELTRTARLTEDADGRNDNGSTTHLALPSPPRNRSAMLLKPNGTLAYRARSVIGDMTGIPTKTS